MRRNKPSVLLGEEKSGSTKKAARLMQAAKCRKWFEILFQTKKWRVFTRLRVAVRVM
jgi:hypothetical protein